MVPQPAGVLQLVLTSGGSGATRALECDALLGHLEPAQQKLVKGNAPK